MVRRLILSSQEYRRKQNSSCFVSPSEAVVILNVHFKCTAFNPLNSKTARYIRRINRRLTCAKSSPKKCKSQPRGEHIPSIAAKGQMHSPFLKLHVLFQTITKPLSTSTASRSSRGLRWPALREFGLLFSNIAPNARKLYMWKIKK